MLGPILSAEGKPGHVQRPRPAGRSTGIHLQGGPVLASILSQRRGNGHLQAQSEVRWSEKPRRHRPPAW